MSSKQNAKTARSSSVQPPPTGGRGSNRGKGGKQRQNQSQIEKAGYESSSVPAAIGTVTRSNEPRITRTKHSCRVQHRELVVPSLAGATTFTFQAALKINPGLAETFPWLAAIAGQWEQYVCHKLRAQFLSTVSTGTAGEVLITPSYDPSDPIPATEQAACAAVGSIATNSWKSITMDCDKSAMMALGPRRFVRQCAQAGDIKTFDVANIYLYTNDCANTSKLGKVWLEYDFEFFVPQNDPTPNLQPVLYSEYRSSTDITFLSGALTLINIPTLVFDPLSIGPQTTFEWLPPKGCYRVTYHISIASDANNTTLSAAAYLSISGGTTPLAGSRSEFLCQGSVSSAAQGNLSGQVIFTCDGVTSIGLSVIAADGGGNVKAIGNTINVQFSLA